MNAPKSQLGLLVGPAGSGKTTRLLAHALAAAHAGKRVWWVGLPSQRSYLYTRAAREGGVLGLEFLSQQQVYYRLLAHALKLKPLLVGTGRIALVGEALKLVSGEVPAPGEARLFTRAVAEAKRYGVGWAELPETDREGERFREVFRAYEEVKGERWDYDDFRREAYLLAASKVSVEADLVIVDGFRELGPLELGLYGALARRGASASGNALGVWLSLPTAPPGMAATESLAPRPNEPTVYRAANPVAEARWVLRALKRDLASGYGMLELAVVLPEREVRAFVALADEYGVPLMDETPKALSDTPGGRLLLDLLELPDTPTPSRLLAIPELAPLANAALKRGVVGREALTQLAHELGLAAPLKAWLTRLDAPGDELSFARELLESLPELSRAQADRPENRPDGREGGVGWRRFKEHALERAKEAAHLAKGAHFRAWWGALLQETRVFAQPKGGVALLTPTLVSGRRFRRVYLMRALEGAYSAGEGEDYFVPEEARGSLGEIYSRLGLPKRFLGRDPLLFAELLTRGDELIVTYPEADQGGPRAAEGALTRGARTPPELPAGSSLELGDVRPYRPGSSKVSLKRPSVQALSRYDRCAFRFWAEGSSWSETPPETPWWRVLVAELRTLGRLNAARLAVLAEGFPAAARWLSEHEELLLTLTFGVTLPERGDGPYARLDAATRTGGAVRLYTFVAPEFDGDVPAFVGGRSNELWAAAHLLEKHRMESVELYLWSLLGLPQAVYDAPLTRVLRPLESKQRFVAHVYARFETGEASPKPGFDCRACGVFDLCRAGTR